MSILFDGSVLVTSGGLEVGQGLATKVKQVCQNSLDASRTTLQCICSC